MVKNINLNPDTASCKIRNTGRRMKIYIKLNKSETEGWNQIKKGFEGFEGTESQLVKMMFFRGVNAFMEDLKEQVDNLSEEEKASILEEANSSASGTVSGSDDETSN